jgi:very-short-patch-repair endonuclease
MGLNPVIALTKTHAFAGFWLIDECFPVLTNDDPVDLKKRIDASDIVMFETTLITNDAPVTFKQSIERAKTLLDEDKESEFVMLIDIKQARARRVRPIGVIEDKTASNDTISAPVGGSSIGIDAPPPLPPVRGDDRVIEETPDTRVDIWQRKLLDLTKRNPLLNVKNSALKLFCPNLGALEDMLAADEEFSFIAADDTPLFNSERSTEAFRLSTGEDLHREFALQQLNNKKLILNDTTKRKDAKLVELLRKAKNDLEEGGSNTLFLAIGMLRWKETPESDKSFRAPLILLPVKLERRSAQAPIKLRQLPDEEPVFNSTLIEMLQSDYDINLDQLRHDLPKDESGVDVEGIWNIVRTAIKEQPGFIVIEEVVLGSFSFVKYLMWKDLRDRTELLKQNPFVEHLIDHPADAYQQESNFVDRDQVDDKIKPESFYAPLKCDSSQMVAVEASSHPQDFVLEGPPGTGKSETITNMICHNLALGRKVLFVAEKMAALNVVYRRMEKVGLSHLCLELHSNKANKKSVLDQLSNAWAQRETAIQSDWIAKAKKLEEVRHALNNYVSELHRHHAIGLSARDAMARVVRFQQEHPLRLSWPTDLSQAPVKSESDLDSFLATARELAIAFGEVQDLEPGSFKAITQIEFSNHWQAETITIANRINAAVNRARTSTVALLEALATPIDHISLAKSSMLSSLAELCDLVMNGDVDYALQNGGSANVSTLSKSISLHNKLLAQVSDFGHRLKWTMLESCDWEQWISQRNEAIGLFGFFKRYYLRKAIRATGLDNIENLDILELGMQARETLKQLNKTAKEIEGTGAWTGIDTDSKHLSRVLANGERALELIKDFLAAFPDPSIPVGMVRRQLVEGRDFLSENSQIVSLSRRLAEDVAALKELGQEAEALSIVINRDDELAKIGANFKVIAEEGQRLSRWCRWLAAKKVASTYQLEPLSEALESRVIVPADCEDNAMTALCVWLAPQLIDQSPVLVKFAGASHESTIERFRELDSDVSATTSEFIIAKTASNVPDRNSPATPAEFGVLARELTKKTRHKPVRMLINEMGSSLTDLVPCFMMSPLSVAQFLPADFALFDLVIFDEASQITTWDAVGAVARGKNVIVVGDPKQMPPSNNFGRKEDEDSDEGDLESILDQALAARLPHLRLTGHYRSRHETLIAFSNSHYYDNQLNTFPSAETKQSAVMLYRVDGAYAKGRGQTNTIEAQAVVNEVVRRLHRMLKEEEPVKSIGIVTINSQQQRMVEDFIDEARRKNPELECFFTATEKFDPVFVKNLESVQGDERDIIVLSLTYGPTEPGGRTMSMNFGPLNKQGGERRLNVAITRATTEVLVFSSFDSSMIDLSRTQATAVEHLKNYLEFAERGPVALAEFSSSSYGVDQFDSDFEQAVAISLREKGWKVQTQVGVSKFRIDLGIIHPDKPGEYLAGVECDGATYHGSPSARDRDRVRHAILEKLGWRIVRLWSTDYFQEPDYAMKKLNERLDAFLAEDRSSIGNAQKTSIALHSSNEPDIATSQSDSVKVNTFETEQENLETGSESYLKVANAARLAGLERPASNVEPGYQNIASDNGDVLADLPCYDKERYFHDDHRINLSRLAKAVLERKNGITMHELMLDVANKHGLTRSSKKQCQHLREVISSWAGFWCEGEEKTTVFLSPEHITEEIKWRGLYAFGVERDWKDLCYQEQIGISRAALKAQPNDPIEWLFNEFKIARRHSSTAETFQSWIDRVNGK